MISLPDGPGPFSLVVVCHPHPLYGGNMFNNVVHAVCETLTKKGIAWLKFNFRGVGKSGGSHSDGIGEQEDAQAAISFAEKQGPIDGGRIGICGYSFGSTVAFAVAVKEPRVRAVAGISPFIQPPDLLDFYSHPKLFVSGTYDDFIDPRNLEKQVERLPAPKELVLYPGVDHFWMKDDDAMAEKVGQFFKNAFALQI
jgi:alpha/beta superfamily hydrolase